MTVTIAQSPTPRRFSQDRLQQALAALYAAVWVWAAIAPVSRMDWFLENLLIVVGVIFLFFVYRRGAVSDVSSILITLFLILHTIGSHYTYSKVPIGDWVKDALGLERNHYDRVVHFTFGLFLSYPMREVLLRAKIARGAWAALFAFALVASCSALYEIMEWLVGAIVDPEAGLAFLGTQGDVFDSQKDSGLAILGAAITMSVAAFGERKRR